MIGEFGGDKEKFWKNFALEYSGILSGMHEIWPECSDNVYNECHACFEEETHRQSAISCYRFISTRFDARDGREMIISAQWSSRYEKSHKMEDDIDIYADLPSINLNLDKNVRIIYDIVDLD